jgi:hypothetical protein
MMSAAESPASKYFRLLGDFRKQGSTTDAILKLIDMGAHAIRTNDRARTLTVLAGLKELIESARPILDNGTEAQHQSCMELMALRKQLLDVLQQNAVLRGDDQAAVEIGKHITELDDFFSSAIADLDPDG